MKGAPRPGGRQGEAMALVAGDDRTAERLEHGGAHALPGGGSLEPAHVDTADGETLGEPGPHARVIRVDTPRGGEQ